MKKYYIIGQPYINQTVYAEDEKIAQSSSAIEFEWQHSNSYSSGYTAITNATNYNYVLASDDVYVRCKVTDNTLNEYTYTDTIKVLTYNYKSNTQQAVTDTVGAGASLNQLINKTTGKTNIVSDVERINQSLDIILNSDPDETPILTVGSKTLQDSLYEEITPSLLDRLKVVIQGVIEVQQPKITTEDIVVEADTIPGLIRIKIPYKINGTNIQSTYTSILKQAV